MTQSPDIPTLAAALKSRITPWAKTNLNISSEFYFDGQWHIADENTAWYLQPCFGALAATLWRYDTSLVKYRDIAIDTVEAAFKWNLNVPTLTTPRFIYVPTPGYPTSLFTGLSTEAKMIASFDGGPWGNPDPIGSDENGTIEAGATFCWIIDMLYFGPDGKPSGGIDKPTALRWIQNLKYAADWLIDWNGNPIWFTNGNYVAHQALFYTHLAILCRKLGDEAGWQRYSQAYELTLQTLIYPFGNNPPANAQWAGYGYIVTTPGTGSTGDPPNCALLAPTGTSSDGSNEVGHPVEVGSHVANPTATFDGVYHQTTLDLLAVMYMINRDWRVNYLLNASWNAIVPITDFSAYTITTTGGSRNPGVSIRGWTGGYQNIIALLGRRSQNRTYITNVVCLGAWDNQMASNLTDSTRNEINQASSFGARLYRTSAAASLHACYLVDKKLL